MVNTEEQTMGDRIRELRKARGLTLQAVGDRFGINRSSVSAWESGSSRPDFEKLPELADLLQTTVDYLLTGKETIDVEHILPASKVAKLNEGVRKQIRETEAKLASMNWRNHIVHHQTTDLGPGALRGTSYALPSLLRDVAALAGGIENDDLRHELMDRLAKLRVQFDGRIPLLRWRDAGYWIVDDPDDENAAMERYRNSPLYDPDRVAFRGIRTGGRLMLPKNVSANVFGYSTLRNDLREDAIRCPFPCNPGTFALSIESDEFYDPEGGLLTIREGDTIAVDPAQTVQEMDVVVIRHMATNTSSLRLFMTSMEGRPTLYAMNSERSITDDIDMLDNPEIIVVGRVLGMWRQF
ncbi:MULTISPECIES: helix-turn-helix domain-containing protein [unclassified Caballeronia]|uniref:helix-turn-helix domain-containing protein n=1 Tax=unclassified Caballeronia TaxID=2646786 RepID=UPI0028645635|nr:MULTISPECIES: helix-turn-helix domain-containing protein [unclassified Caballeronia]MDR5772096.1 helix-turn-helix domain-containing protein [Caballeronia sp. LZ002]MDR5847530.1 helix-turn-helix domain-containing protein [Caballeronia sp. LZ003]